MHYLSRGPPVHLLLATTGLWEHVIFNTANRIFRWNGNFAHKSRHLTLLFHHLTVAFSVLLLFWLAVIVCLLFVMSFSDWYCPGGLYWLKESDVMPTPLVWFGRNQQQLTDFMSLTASRAYKNRYVFICLYELHKYIYLGRLCASVEVFRCHYHLVGFQLRSKYAQRTIFFEGISIAAR